MFETSNNGDDDDSPKTHSHSILLNYLSPCPVTIRTGALTHMHTYSHNHACMLRTALEKLDLCWLLDMLYVDIHDSFMDLYQYVLIFLGKIISFLIYSFHRLFTIERKTSKQQFSFLFLSSDGRSNVDHFYLKRKSNNLLYSRHRPHQKYSFKNFNS